MLPIAEGSADYCLAYNMLANKVTAAKVYMQYGEMSDALEQLTRAEEIIKKVNQVTKTNAAE